MSIKNSAETSGIAAAHGNSSCGKPDLPQSSARSGLRPLCCIKWPSMPVCTDGCMQDRCAAVLRAWSAIQLVAIQSKHVSCGEALKPRPSLRGWACTSDRLYHGDQLPSASAERVCTFHAPSGFVF